MKVKHLDVTIDLESCSLAANAAVLQVAAVAWNRTATDVKSIFALDIIPFESKVDLRSCVMDGFDFDPATLKWWSEKPKELKMKMASGDCYPIEEVFRNLSEWMAEAKKQTEAETITLWAQGTDMDIAILRHVCQKYNIHLPLTYRDFRDARTFIIEIGSLFLLDDWQKGMADHDRVYDELPDVPETDSEEHNAVYDAYRTSWNLWQCFSLLPDRS